ncbi:MAG: AbrB/MazE/SpoVT family DNA-binding domain-containing protein [Chthoniobacterales bacterium]|nr:AbrB/MazE/SpoVT family DNA-binding domain-containing protein [Chthoniobacterales bacterium]
MITKITGKNQVTLPADLMREMGWEIGMRLKWEKGQDGSVIVRPLPTRGELGKKLMGLKRTKGSGVLADVQQIRDSED